MGYALAISPCVGCGRIFGYNPELVPSIRVRRNPDSGQWVADPSGSAEPICAACVAAANPERVKNGLEPITVHPEAYEAAEGF